MDPAKKASTKKARSASKARASSRTSDRARKRVEETDRVVRRINKSLDSALAELGKVGGSVGDVRRDLAKLLRDARRSAAKMSNATRKDLERLQKDVTAAAKGSGRRTKA